MDVPSLQRHIQATDVPPEQLAGNTQLSEQEKIGEASRQFEAVLLRQILENSQKPVIKSKLTPESTSTSIYRDLITSHLADSISKSGEFGLARTFEQQLNRQLHPASKDTPAATTAPASTTEASAASASPVAARPPHWPFADSFRQYESRHPKAAAPKTVATTPAAAALARKKNAVPVKSALRGQNLPPLAPGPRPFSSVNRGASHAPAPGVYSNRAVRAARGASLLVSTS